MPITEVNVFGVYVSPYAVILLLVWVLVLALRVGLTRPDVLRHAWHPAPLMFSVLTSLFSPAVLLAAGLS